ncbi:zinc-dependent metalloprotease [Ichthyenterobacterium magnum]|uniref:Putative secreted protein (Por secretion system target) n=1 Tax=Ichthyenterobacterium magnum TaxID=1230530 RepID=A0A420DFW9_9FLAO|nr:zinc-dependent metalloprotease [Ichthyenterobacterium magnum]RKE92026.1 putative secreted protein (Por secretion system target) [Ichthyenterobacterium magnum]
MKKTIICLGLIIGLLSYTNRGFSQNRTSFWSKSDGASLNSEKWKRSFMPTEYLVFDLDINNLLVQLQNAPNRKTSKFESGVIVSFPSIDGRFEDYEVYEAPVLDFQLQSNHLDIRSFVGKSLKDKSKIIRFSVSLFGFKALILNAKEGTQYIDCLTKDRLSYIMYLKQHVSADQYSIECLTDDSEAVLDNLNRIAEPNDLYRNANDGKLREFKLALACTEEYATYHVNEAGLGMATEAIKKDAVLAVMNDVMTRVNAVYENELALTMTIVNNNRNVIFITDTFLDNDNIGTLIDESQFFIDAFIGEPYDIGHMLSTSGSGLAQLFSPCTSNKSRAVSGGLGGAPIGIVFENTLLHEMGHQYGAFHTWSAPGCFGTYSASSAYEPGGGTTIMSYAGICGASANIQQFADTYFHQNSLQQMWNNIAFGVSTCAQQTDTGNSVPTANAGNDYTIPFGTPFKLVGVGTDDGSSLTYCWEQFDANGPEAIPGEFTVDGPVIRSFPPETINTRYIPRLEDYVSSVNTSTSWEKLVLVNRDLNFRFTVRDNDLSGGQTATDGMVVTVTNTSGPFIVTSQNTDGIVYEGNSLQTITWNKANTDIGLVSASNVDILLSTDGGLNFDTVLISNTPNDGSEDVTLANVDSASCRIMVVASNNIFYNINSKDFQINQSLSLEDESFAENLSIYPNPNSGEFHINFITKSIDAVNVFIYDIRGRVIFMNTYSQTIEFDESIKLNNIHSGLYLINITSGNSKVTKKIVVN